IVVRDRGCVIMKMISSTSRMSIMGTTFGSDVRVDEPPPTDMPMLLALLLLLCLFGGEEPAVAVGHSGDDPYASRPGDLDGLLHRPVLQLVVGPEVQDLVLFASRVLRLQLVLERA